MIRRLFVCMAVLGWIALWVPSLVLAQCGANPCYTVNPPVYVHLTPAQAAALGYPTATINAIPKSELNGGTASHVISLFDGTETVYAFDSSNAPTGAYGIVTYSKNGAAPVQLATGFTGSIDSAGWWGANNTVVITFTLYDSNGNVLTSDRVTEAVFAVQAGQSPIVFQDERPENTYVQINTSGGGGSMAADFVECQAGQIHQCINATHTPFTQVLITNPATGDSLFHPKHVGGNVAKYNEQVSYGDSLCCISMLNEDVLQFSEDDEVDCSVAGPVPPPPKHQDVQFGMKITYTWVSALTKSNGFHPQAPYCSDASSPPDWPGPFEATANTKSGEYAGAEEMYREVPAGQSFTGVKWSWWFSYISEPYIYPTDPYPPNCTNTDKGFKNGVNVFWPLPGLPF